MSKENEDKTNAGFLEVSSISTNHVCLYIELHYDSLGLKMKNKCLMTMFAVFLVVSIPYAVSASLNIDVSVASSELAPLMEQQITATANERGMGVLLVLQPAEGTPWIDYLNDHPLLAALFNSLPSNVQSSIADKIGQKIVSFKIVSFGGGGGNSVCVFPSEFNGINGAPSTALVGEYTVLFAYASWEEDGATGLCFLAEKEFDCKIRSFNVIPEVPFGTVMAVSSMGLATFGYITIKKHKKNKTN